MYSRFCPNCNNVITYKHLWVLKRAIKENRACNKCKHDFYPAPNKGKTFSHETRSKMSVSLKGRKAWNKGIQLSLSHKKNLSDSLKGRTVWSKGQKFSIDYKIKLSQSHRGNPSPMKGKKHTEEARYKIRCKVIEDLKNKGISQRNFNPKACQFIDIFGNQNGYNFQHALNGGEVELYGYFVDGYDKTRNAIFEYDEPKHDQPTKKKKDLIRQAEIIKHIVPSEFWRFSERYNKLERIL